jgi:plastocyanin
MKKIRRFSRVKLLLAAAILAIGPSTLGFAYASGVFSAAQPTSPTHYTVYIGGGHNNDDFTNILYTPDKLNIYVGDTVTFVTLDQVEPHTVSFGTYNMLSQLANQVITPVTNNNGPPTLTLLPKVVEPTKRTTYDGNGYANSGILSSDYHGITRTIKFTAAGTFQYYCLIHFPFMVGTITVNPRPSTSNFYTVQAGYFNNGPLDNTSTADTFFPGNLKVHVGDTVQWVGGFHTVTFATANQIASLRTQFVIRTKDKFGNYHYTINPEIAFPSRRDGCGTSAPCVYTGGYLSSGFISTPNGNGAGSFMVKFTKAGVYHYGCLVHKGMDGQITVLPAGRSRKT